MLHIQDCVKRLAGYQPKLLSTRYLLLIKKYTVFPHICALDTNIKIDVGGGRLPYQMIL